jgi:flagellar P-ring protein precursor FlgI
MMKKYSVLSSQCSVRRATHWVLGTGYWVLATCALLLGGAGGARAQEVRIRDLTLEEQAVPVRLMGYGLVVGLDGTGDRAMGSRGGGHTVQSVANLLKRFNVEVPPQVLSLRNVAAVLVTAEVSPYLRPGGRFEVNVSSLGDARSIRGGVLWMTPLVSDVGGEPVASAQGPMLISEGGGGRGGYSVETTARIPGGGLLEGSLPRPQFAQSSRLVLKEPDLGTATRIATAINAALGGNAAMVEDPGAVALSLPEGDRAGALARIGELRVQPDRASRVVIDSRSGTVVAGGEIIVGPGSVSHGAVTLTIGAQGAGGAGRRGGVSVPTGTTVQQVTSALHAADTPPQDIAAILESLQRAGALAAEVVIR